VMNTSSVLNVELGGLTQGTQYDWINVQGAANLAGTLNVTSYNGYVPTTGSEYTFLNFASRVGDFNTVNLNTLSGLSVVASAGWLKLVQGSTAAATAALTQTLQTNPVLVIEDRLDTAVDAAVQLKPEPTPAKDQPDVEVCP
jgi:hypothetical protein